MYTNLIKNNEEGFPTSEHDFTKNSFPFIIVIVVKYCTIYNGYVHVT